MPLVLAVYTRTGTDHDPRRYVVARSPSGGRLSVLECSWRWPDPEGELFKSAGVHTIGLYHSPDATQPAYAFPLSVQVGRGGAEQISG